MLRLEPRLRAIVEQEYPRFSDAEYARRHRALAAVMGKHDLDHLLVVTDHRTGNAPQWVTGWPGTVEAYVVFRPGEKMTMHVEWYNHFPLARKLARDAGFESLLHGTKPGMTERELGNLVERAYVGEGGTTFIHFIGVTSMAQPEVFVPPQFHSARRVQRGDVVFCELSGMWWDYPGQV